MNLELENKLKQAASSEVRQVDLWKKIETRLQSEHKGQTWRGARGLAAALGIVLIGLLTVVFVPQARVLAQEIIEGIGNIRFLRETPTVFEDSGSADDLSSEGTGGRELIGESGQDSEGASDLSAEEQAGILDWVTHDESDTAAKAEAILGSHLLQASELPGGYSLEYIEATRTDYGVRTAYSTFYRQNTAGDQIAPLLLTQTLMPENAPENFGSWQIGESALVSDTTVRGLPGKYVQGAEIAVVPQDILSWREDGFDFSIIVESGSLTLEDLQRFADGLE